MLLERYRVRSRSAKARAVSRLRGSSPRRLGPGGRCEAGVIAGGVSCDTAALRGLNRQDARGRVSMYAVRLWSVRHAGLLAGVYAGFERLLRLGDPLLRRIGYDRLEAPVATVERGVKGFLFDCRMCGQCVLGSTG